MVILGNYEDSYATVTTQQMNQWVFTSVQFNLVWIFIAKLSSFSAFDIIDNFLLKVFHQRQRGTFFLNTIPSLSPHFPFSSASANNLLDESGIARDCCWWGLDAWS